MARRPIRHIAVLVETDDNRGRDVIEGVAQYAQTRGFWGLVIEPRDRRGRLRLQEGWSADGIIARISSPTKPWKSELEKVGSSVSGCTPPVLESRLQAVRLFRLKPGLQPIAIRT